MSYINALLRAPKDINVDVNTKVMSTIKTKKLMQCTCCLNKYNIDINEPLLKYYKHVVQNPEDKTIYFKKYDEVLKQEFVCLKCQQLYLNECNCCSKLFHIDSTVDGWEDSLLTINVIVCVKCFFNEACTSCRYLGGASPCRFCRARH